MIFRDMEHRSIARVAQILGKYKTNVERTASKYEWQVRAAAWDNELDRRLREMEVGEAKKMVDRQIKLAQAVQHAATVEIMALIKRIEEVDKAAASIGKQRAPIISTRDMVRLIETGTKLERLNRGMPNEIGAEVAADGGPVDRITVEFVKGGGSGEHDGK